MSLGAATAKLKTKKGGKAGVTAVLAVTASGRKLDTMFIKRVKTEKTLADIAPRPHTVWTFAERGWMTEELMIRLLNDIILPYANGRLVVLLMDAYKAHWTDRSALHRSQHPPHHGTTHQNRHPPATRHFRDGPAEKRGPESVAGGVDC